MLNRFLNQAMNLVGSTLFGIQVKIEDTIADVKADLKEQVAVVKGAFKEVREEPEWNQMMADINEIGVMSKEIALYGIGFISGVGSYGLLPKAVFDLGMKISNKSTELLMILFDGIEGQEFAQFQQAFTDDFIISMVKSLEESKDPFAKGFYEGGRLHRWLDTTPAWILERQRVILDGMETAVVSEDPQFRTKIYYMERKLPDARDKCIECNLGYTYYMTKMEDLPVMYWLSDDEGRARIIKKQAQKQFQKAQQPPAKETSTKETFAEASYCV